MKKQSAKIRYIAIILVILLVVTSTLMLFGIYSANMSKATRNAITLLNLAVYAAIFVFWNIQKRITKTEDKK